MVEKEQWQFFKACCGKGFFPPPDRPDIYLFTTRLDTYREAGKESGMGPGLQGIMGFFFFTVDS